jgi:hypothetical protein
VVRIPDATSEQVRAMVAKVTNEGLLIPKELLGSADEVQILEEPGRIIVILEPDNDPIWNLGKNPIKLGITDAAENLDKYLYGK